MKNGLMHELVHGKKSKSKGAIKNINLGVAMPSDSYLVKELSFAKPKRSKNNNILRMFPKPTIKKMVITKHNIIGDKKTKSQIRYLKTYSGTHRFMDSDKDGVINGLDCQWKDPSKHGVITKFKNWVSGRGFRENDITPPMPPPAPQVSPERNVRRYNNLEVYGEPGTSSFPQKIQSGYDVVAGTGSTWGGAIKETGEQIAQTYPGQAARYAGEKFKQGAQYIGSGIKQTGTRAKEALKEKLKEKGYEGPEGEFSATAPISKRTGYIFETPERRAMYKEKDLKKRQQKAIANVIGLSAYNKGSQSKFKTKLKELKSLVEDNDITELQYTEALEREAEQARQERNLNKEKEKMQEVRAKRFYQEQPVYQQQLEAQRLDALRKQEISKANIERAKYEQDRVKGFQQSQQPSYNLIGGQGSGYLGSIQSQGFFAPQYTEQSETKDIVTSQGIMQPYKPRYEFEVQDEGRWDPNAPRFVYRKKSGSITRKSNFVRKSDNPELNKPSRPGKSGKVLYGYERVYAGKGKFIKRGRPKIRKKSEYSKSVYKQ